MGVRHNDRVPPGGIHRTHPPHHGHGRGELRVAHRSLLVRRAGRLLHGVRQLAINHRAGLGRRGLQHQPHGLLRTQHHTLRPAHRNRGLLLETAHRTDGVRGVRVAVRDERGLQARRRRRREPAGHRHSREPGGVRDRSALLQRPDGVLDALREPSDARLHAQRDGLRHDGERVRVGDRRLFRGLRVRRDRVREHRVGLGDTGGMQGRLRAVRDAPSVGHCGRPRRHHLRNGELRPPVDRAVHPRQQRDGPRSLPRKPRLDRLGLHHDRWDPPRDVGLHRDGSRAAHRVRSVRLAVGDLSRVQGRGRGAVLHAALHHRRRGRGDDDGERVVRRTGPLLLPLVPLQPGDDRLHVLHNHRLQLRAALFPHAGCARRGHGRRGVRLGVRHADPVQARHGVPVLTPRGGHRLGGLRVPDGGGVVRRRGALLGAAHQHARHRVRLRHHRGVLARRA
mmetsp:Transcript_20442/g.49478  ORF Transcript_20442/g.49478 Transcript_20442/m.49478 type:complete len:451 (+) Transcript_20442:759-2111(+)